MIDHVNQHDGEVLLYRFVNKVANANSVHFELKTIMHLKTVEVKDQILHLEKLKQGLQYSFYARPGHIKV